jgi:hypothetical protein
MSDAIFTGGPQDGNETTAADAGLVEVEIDGLVHRYIRTSQRRATSGGELTIYTYDGVIDPTGAEDGVEHAVDRAASPLAAQPGDQ